MESLGPRSGRGAVGRSASGLASGRLRAWFVVASAALVAACAAPPAPSQLSDPLPKDAPVSLAVAGTQPPAAASEFKQLNGLSEAELRHLLGEPDFRRHEAPAEIWQYRGADCILDLFLYRSAGKYRVAYAETHDRGVISVSQSSCYAGLAARHPRLRQSQL